MRGERWLFCSILLILLLVLVSGASSHGGPRVFINHLARKLGIVDFYSSLYRGVQNTLIQPIFGGGGSKRQRHRPRRPPVEAAYVHDVGSNSFYDYVMTGSEQGDDQPLYSENLDVITAAPTEMSPPMTTKPSGIYIMPAPDLATEAATRLYQVTSPESVRTLPAFPPRHSRLFLPAPSTTSSSGGLDKFFSSTPPTVISNYSSVSVLPWEKHRERAVSAVYAVSTSTERNFYFTTGEKKKEKEETTTFALEESEFFRRPETTTPEYKAFYLPPSPPPRTTTPSTSISVNSAHHVDRLRNHRRFSEERQRTRTRSYETTTLPKLFVSSIPPPRYHRVNSASADDVVYKDPLHSFHRLTTTTEPPDTSTFATLQPRFQELDDEEEEEETKRIRENYNLFREQIGMAKPISTVVGRGPKIVSHGSPRYRQRNLVNHNIYTSNNHNVYRYSNSHNFYSNNGGRRQYKTLVPLSILKVYPIYVGEDMLSAGSSSSGQDMMGSEPVASVAMAEEEGTEVAATNPERLEGGRRSVVRVFGPGGRPFLRLSGVGAGDLSAEVVKEEGEEVETPGMFPHHLMIETSPADSRRVVRLTYSFNNHLQETIKAEEEEEEGGGDQGRRIVKLRRKMMRKRRKSRVLLRREIARLLEEIEKANDFAATNSRKVAEEEHAATR